ncbi:MAG: hypothetical protein ACXVH3_26105 [Solirubrobacteraceae bacterium]
MFRQIVVGVDGQEGGRDANRQRALELLDSGLREADVRAGARCVRAR